MNEIIKQNDCSNDSVPTQENDGINSKNEGIEISVDDTALTCGNYNR